MLNQFEINFFITRILNLSPNLKITPQELERLIFPKKKYRIVGVYGHGGNGLILKVQSNSDSNTYAIKLSPASEQSLYEFDIQVKFAAYDMAPNVYLYDITEGSIRNYNVKFVRAVMDPITSTVFQYLKSGYSSRKLQYPFECLIKKKYILQYPNSFLHCDMHCNNIVILQDGKTLGFIDFGLSREKPSALQILDSIPLITSCKYSVPTRQSELLSKFLLKLYNKMFNVNMKLENFVSRQQDGYAYKFNNYYLHSYDWAPGGSRNPLPTVRDIKYIFPSFEPPEVE